MNKYYILFLFAFLSVSAFSQGREIPVVKNSSKLEIYELSQINSSYRETNLNISPDGKYLYFMSDRGGQSWSSVSGTFNGKSRYDGDIWYSKKNGNEWQSPKCLSSNVNTWSGEDEPNISPDGQRVYFESWKSSWQTSGGPYYTSELNGNVWGTPEGLGGGITEFFKGEYNKRYYYATDGMAISPDGNTFIVSCGGDYDGNLDLFVGYKKNGRWEVPQKMNISTDYDDRSIFIAGDGHTIFFASDGYGGFGGLDIFMGTLQDDGKCVNVKNIGEPFNTPKDDYGFIITASGEEAYFVRDGDVFYAKLPPSNELSPEPTVIVSGKLVNCANIPMEMHLYLKDATGKIVVSSKSASNGEFVFSFPEKSGKYEIYDDHDNLLKSFTVKKLDQYQEIKFDLKNCNRIRPPSKSAVKSK
ncbi:MAG: PD40 domain-containing protein [Bacteroidales bacterium]|nr:PD40 domain-containing protein [Bacteroidales bacterium]